MFIFFHIYDLTFMCAVFHRFPLSSSHSQIHSPLLFNYYFNIRNIKYKYKKRAHEIVRKKWYGSMDYHRVGREKIMKGVGG